MKPVVLKFSIDNINFKDTHDKRFKRAIIYAFADGENAHTQPITLEVLKKGSETVYDIPILCKYSKFFDDFEGHEEDEIPIGFVKESTSTYSNPIRFERVEDGRTFLVIEATIWANYAGEAMNVLDRDKTKPVSVELTCQGIEVDDRVDVEDFILQGITILGDFINPAVKGANLKMKFSKEKKEYLKSLKFADENFQSKGTYLVASYKIAKARNIFTGQVRDNLIRKFIELGLNEENYHGFGITLEEFEEDFYEFNNESVGERSMAKEKLTTKEEMAGVVSAAGTGELKASPEVKAAAGNSTVKGVDGATGTGEVKEKSFEDKPETKPAEMAGEEKKVEEKMEQEVKPEDKEMSDGKPAEMEEKVAEPVKEPTEDMSIGYISDPNVKLLSVEDVKKMQSQLDALKKANEELQVSNTAYMEQINKMSDYEELSKFKQEMEAKFEQEEKMAKIQKVFSEIESRGISMSDEDKKSIADKLPEFDTSDAWANFAKATAFDAVENADGVVRIGNAFKVSDSDKFTSVWDRI